MKREAPAAAPAFGGMRGEAVVGGIGFFSGKPLGPMPIPDPWHFQKIAHWLIAWHLGVASGQFAAHSRSARQIG